MRKCIEHLVCTSEHAVWVNLTFWENVTEKAYAVKCWNKLQTALVRANPDFRLVGVWARQRRGAWHIHAVCNQRFDIDKLRSIVMRSGFGPQFYVRELDSHQDTPQKIARYITGYCTDKNGLDPERDKGVRRTIFVGAATRVVDMRYKSSLKRVTTIGRNITEDITNDTWGEASDFERDYSFSEGRKKIYETWGAWYKRNRDYWFRVGWESLSEEEKEEMYLLDEFISRYFETGRWSYV